MRSFRSNLILRSADISDVEVLAKIQVDGWRHAFKEIVPKRYLDGLNYEDRAKRWRQIIGERKERFHIVVAEIDSEVIGFSCGGPNRSDVKDYDGELWAIYVSTAQQDKGFGKKLVNETRRRLRKDGFKEMIIWCLRDNAPSIAFYKALGGKMISNRLIEIGGANLPEIGFGWDLEP